MCAQPLRDVLMLAREYDMINDVLHFNVVDNVLLIHHTNSSVVAVYDLASPSSLPIGSPLPISGTPPQTSITVTASHVTYTNYDICKFSKLENFHQL